MVYFSGMKYDRNWYEIWRLSWTPGRCSNFRLLERCYYRYSNEPWITTIHYFLSFQPSAQCALILSKSLSFNLSSLNCVVIQQRILLCQSINFRRSQNHNWSIIQSSSVLSNYFLFEAVKRWTNQSHPSCLVTKEDVYIHE